MAYRNLLIRALISILIFIIYIVSLNNLFILFSLGLIIYILIFYEVLKNFKYYFLFIILYLLFSFSIYVIYFYNFYNIYYFNILIFVIISFDTSSYLIGSLFGKNYLFKTISPNKTFEGYLGGLILTNIFYLLYIFFYNGYNNLLNIIFLINLIIIFAIFGDLIQSFFKRKNNIKDSSNFLPGHGGFFDRFDSFISSIIFLTLYSYIFL